MIFTLSPRIPDGPWQARIRLQSGLVVRSETATIDFDTAALASSGFPVAPAAGASLIVLTILAAFVIRSRRPERRHA